MSSNQKNPLQEYVSGAKKLQSDARFRQDMLDRIAEHSHNTVSGVERITRRPSMLPKRIGVIAAMLCCAIGIAVFATNSFRDAFDPHHAGNSSTDSYVQDSVGGWESQGSARIFVYMDGGNAPSVVLRLSVVVESGKGENDDWPVQLGRIRMRSKEIHIRKGLKDVRKVRFVNVSDSPLKLECEEMFLPPCLKFSVSPDEVAPGKEGEIVLKYDPSMGNDLGPVRLMLKNLGVSPSQSAIIVKID